MKSLNVLRTLLIGFLWIGTTTFVYAKDFIIIEKDKKYFHNNEDVTGKTINATQGDNLKLINEDVIDHCVKATLNGEVLSDKTQKPKMNGGEDVIISLSKAGKLFLKCDIHPHMILDINVK